MKSQMTLFACGAKCGSPDGGAHTPSLAYPSRCSIAPRARPVKVRNPRRVTGVSGDAETRERGEGQTREDAEN
jgi:hypothetical protein